MLCFEKLGIDKLFVDESQAYKNLDTPTKMRNVSGIGSGGSGRAMQLLMKCKYLDELTGGKGCVFASGTPFETGYLQSEMPILRCLCKMLVQLYVMIFCYRIIASVGWKYQYRLHYSSTCMRYEKICQILFE